MMVVALMMGICVPLEAKTGASPFDDVPPRNWSYAVVDHFIDEGWVEGYPPGLYAAGRALSRYEMGLITTGLLERLRKSPTASLTVQEMDWLQLLVKEYAPELAMLGYYQEPAGAVRSSVYTNGAPQIAGEGSLSRQVWRLSPPEVVVVSGANRWWAVARSAGARAGAGGGSYRLQGEIAPAATPALATASPLIRQIQERMSWESLLASQGESSPRARLVSLGLSSAYTGPPLAQVVMGADGGADEHPMNAGEGADAAKEGSRGFLLSQSGFSLGEGDPPYYLSLGPRTRIGLIKRPRDIWSLEGQPMLSNGQLLAEWEMEEYDLVIELGDVRITTGQATFYGTPLSARGQRQGSAGITALSRGASGARLDSGLPLLDDETRVGTNASRTGVDMDLRLSQARLHLGWSYEGELDRLLSGTNTMTRAGMEYQLDANAHALAEIALEDKDEGTTRTTQLGLRYRLSRDSSLLLGYRLIDFTDLKSEDGEAYRTNMATAEFSIRF